MPRKTSSDHRPRCPGRLLLFFLLPSLSLGQRLTSTSAQEFDRLAFRATSTPSGTATARDKFRPVLMGGIVAAFGLLPASMARGVGSQIQRPLAIVVVAGMSVGMTLILIIMPLLLEFVEAEDRRETRRPSCAIPD